MPPRHCSVARTLRSTWRVEIRALSARRCSNRRVARAVAETTSWVIGAPIKIILIIAGALILNRLARALISRGMRTIGSATEAHGHGVVRDRSVERAEARAETLGSLLRSVATATIYAIAIIMILEIFGVGIVPIIASAGVLSIAIGFGAQSIVEDLLRGVFMLAEDQFGVGDRIALEHVNGTVERITLRTVVLRDEQGTVWHVPNSEINFVANENQLTSRATLNIGVAYNTDLERAITVLTKAVKEAAADPDWADVVTQEPEVLGVQALAVDDVQIRIIVWVLAGERRRFERHLRLKIKEALDEAKIVMPNRQVDVWLQNEMQAA